MNINKNKKSKDKIHITKYKIVYVFILFFLIQILSWYNNIFNKSIPNQNDDLTLVSAYYRVKSRHSYTDYLKWINNIVLLNKSIVFFTNKELMGTLKALRPKKLYYKTIFIELEIKDFYSYKKFFKEFNKTFLVDIEHNIHSVPLFMIWAEKCMFLKKVIKKNYFNSKCFYWIDIGYFRENKNDMKKYLNNWPSTKKCYEDNRLLLGQVKHFSDIDKKNIIKFNYDAHISLQINSNVAAGLFGGQIKNTLLFIELYYKIIKLFLKHKIFIGKEQNIFTYIAFAHPEIVKLVFSRDYYLKQYLS